MYTVIAMIKMFMFLKQLFQEELSEELSEWRAQEKELLLIGRSQAEIDWKKGE